MLQTNSAAVANGKPRLRAFWDGSGRTCRIAGVFDTASFVRR
jgi:hypothetical protein